MKRKYSPGDIVGPYTVLGYMENSRMLKCKCNTCGSIVEVFSSNATRQRMCRNCRAKYNSKPREDLTGKQFGRLTVIKAVNKTGNHIAWECKCSCGNIVTVETSHLKDGHTQSCGCLAKERSIQTNLRDLTGKRYGKLTVLQRVEDYITPNGKKLRKYLCQCDCGNLQPVLAMNLVKGNTLSCGCAACSEGETIVANQLRDNGLSFIRQYAMPDLKSEKGFPLRFDFAILQNDKLACLIEYNGEQHYYDKNRKTQFGIEARTKTDKIKRDYCNARNITLFTIRYDEDVTEAMQPIIKYCTEERIYHDLSIAP